MKLPLIIAQRIVNDDGTQVGVDTTVRPSFPYSGTFDVIENTAFATITFDKSSTELNETNSAKLKLDTKDVAISEFGIFVKYDKSNTSILDFDALVAGTQVQYVSSFDVVTNKVEDGEIFIKGITASPIIFSNNIAIIDTKSLLAQDIKLSIDITKSYVVNASGEQKSIDGNLSSYTVKQPIQVTTTTKAPDLPQSGIENIGIYPFISLGIFSIIFLIILIYLTTDTKTTFEKRF